MTKEQTPNSPSWEDFCLKMSKAFPTVTPVMDIKWLNLYMVYQIGYFSALEHVKLELEAENR